MRRPHDVLKLSVAVVMFLLFMIAAEAKMRSNCVCYFEGNCFYDVHGMPLRYHHCLGSCRAYSGWAVYTGCWQSNQTTQKRF